MKEHERKDLKKFEPQVPQLLWYGVWLPPENVKNPENSSNLCKSVT
jgi:hypothetical protein